MTTTTKKNASARISNPIFSADQFGRDAVDALASRSGVNVGSLSNGAAELSNRPLWVIAAQSLGHAGVAVDMYGDREAIASKAMELGNPMARETFYSENENRRYVGASGVPASRPADFPNILSSLANKYLDHVELDDEFSYPEVSAVIPNALHDMKPAPMISMGVVEELDELQDAEMLKELGIEEEVLSYIMIRRFGNKFGWTPVMVANDNMSAFAEGMVGLAEAWQVTQNRLVLDRFTSNETLLDGFPLFADRPAVGSATNKNVRYGGSSPSDSEWSAMDEQYADIGGIGTSRRVRGSLNKVLLPSGTLAQQARRTFFPLNADGLENKVANTTENVGIYRGEVGVIPDSELRQVSKSTWYGLRNPTRLNTATVVRGYFSGYGEKGRRERWFDPTNKTTYISLEGRIGVAVKNWRYAIKNTTEAEA